jgi:hypothetical protein
VNGAAVVVAVLALLGGTAGGLAGAVVSPELIEAAASRGSVRVVVQLEVPASADAAAIDAAKQALWSVLAGTSYRVVRDLPGLPTVVLDASSGALDALAISPTVAHVAADEVRRPQR